MMYIVIVLVILALGGLYQYISGKKDEKEFFPVGEKIDLGETELHYYGEGKGSPTVVFDSGHGVSLSYTDWSLIQSDIATMARTVVYDRAGMGMSRKSRKPRTSEQIVEELHTLLVHAGEKSPYILVGHSFGALNMCLFANKYPDKVAGVVLVDGGSVDCYRVYFRTPRLILITVMMGISVALKQIGFFRAFGKLGLIPHVKERKRKLSSNHSKLDESYFYKHYTNPSMLREAAMLKKSVEQVSKVDSIGDIPLVVISAGQTEKVFKDWLKSQKTLLSLSTNSTHIILEQSGHFIHIDHPEVVNDVIRNMIVKVNRMRREELNDACKE